MFTFSVMYIAETSDLIRDIFRLVIVDDIGFSLVDFESCLRKMLICIRSRARKS